MLTARIRSQPPWSDDEWLESLKKELTDGLVNAGDATAKGFGAMLTSAGIPIDVDHLEPMRAAVDAIRERRPAPANDVLRLLPHTGTSKGTLVYIDEAQLLNVHKGTSTETHAREIIRSLTTAEERHAAGVSHTNIVYAGLGDTGLVLRQLGSLRIDRKRLRGLDHEAQCVVLADAIERGAGGNKALVQKLTAGWVPTLAAMYGEWAHHTQGAAQAAETIIRTAVEHGHDPTEDWGLSAAVELAKAHRNLLYGEILQSCEDLQVPERCIREVAHHLWTERNETSPDTVREVIEAGRKQVTTELGTEEVFARMRRAGLLESDVPNANEPGTVTRVSAPVPSLLTHILGVPDPNLPSLPGGEGLEPMAAGELSTDSRVKH